MSIRFDASTVLASPVTVVSPGSVVVDGDRIAWVGPRAGAPAAEELVDLGQAALTPGLVNAHSHMGLSHLRGRVPFDGDFGAWLAGVKAGMDSPERVVAAQAAIWEAITRGTTTFGDIVLPQSLGEIAGALEVTGARARLFVEVIGFQPGEARKVWRRIEEQIVGTSLPPRAVIGISPHAPYSVSRPLLALACDAAEKRGCPVAIHLAESLEELAFLRHGIGPIREALRNFGVDDPDYQHYGSPAGFLEHVKLSSVPLSLVHGNYLRPRDVPAETHVVYCPTAHQFFRHPEHPVQELLDEGVCVALGSDSGASGDSVDLLSETQLLSSIRVDLAPSAVFRMATVWAARALGLDCGTLEPGKLADLAAFTPDRGFAVLGADDTECILTVVGGDILHRRC